MASIEPLSFHRCRRQIAEVTSCACFEPACGQHVIIGFLKASMLVSVNTIC
jgi:hypothetical protein